jgi:hypothetical protein
MLVTVLMLEDELKPVPARKTQTEACHDSGGCSPECMVTTSLTTAPPAAPVISLRRPPRRCPVIVTVRERVLIRAIL